LLLGARIEAWMPGVAPRLQVLVEFDPSKLLTALLTGRSDRLMSIPDIMSFFAAPAVASAATFTPAPDGSAAQLAQIMTDRVVAAYGDPAPSPRATDPAFVQFRPMAQINTAVTRWDLNAPAYAIRPLVMSFDPVSGMHILNDPAVLAKMVRDISVPALTLGMYRVDLTASLPRSRVGLEAIGARVELAPNPPARPFSVSKTTLFVAPDDRGFLELALAPAEALAFSVTCFAVIGAGGFVKEYDSTPRQHTEAWIQLDADGFPLAFAIIVASSELLHLATIKGVLTYQVEARELQQPFELAAADDERVEVAVAAPAVATDVTMALTAVPLDGGSPVSLPIAAPGRIELDVNSFAGYGPHLVTVQGLLGAEAPPLFIELVTEPDANSAEHPPSKVALTSEQPTATWGYVATSPFRSGYCYRVAAAEGATPAAWSAPLSPDSVLVVNAVGQRQTSNPG